MSRNFVRFLSVTVCLIVAPLSNSSRASQPDTLDDLQTVAEASDFKSTATYDEVMSFCRALDQRSPRVHLATFGKSFEQRELPLLIIANPPAKSAEQLKRSKLTILMMANIHAGEVCGKEAGMMLARELATGRNPLLDRINVLIAPIYNPDGNERMSKDNRPGQIGPENGMGQRHNAQDLDLNRDHIKLDSPEVKAFTKLLNDWDPEIVIDSHTTNGSYHQYALTYDGPRNPAAPETLVEYVRDSFLPAVSQRMQQQSGYRSFYYGDFNRDHDQWITYPDWPRYNTQYVGLRGRIGILSEAYAYIPYKDRVLATKAFVESCLNTAADSGQEIQNMLAAIRLDAGKSSGETIPIASELTPLSNRFDILGYEEQETADGRMKATEQKRTYQGVRYLGLSQPTAAVSLPYAYLIPADQRNVIANLMAHGVQLHELREERRVEVQQYRITNVDRGESSYQGHFPLGVDVEMQSATVQLQPGHVVAKTHQPLCALLVNLLEPEAQDGLCTWNFFDAAVRVDSLFPILRLPDDAALLLAAVPAPSDGTSAKVVTEGVLYGRARPNFDGGLLGYGALKWLNGEKLLHSRGGHWYTIDARSGEMELAINGDRVREALSAALSARPAVSNGIWWGIRPPVSEEQDSSVISHRGDLYRVNLRDASVQRITNSPGAEELAEISPDGQSVAYVRDYNLYVQPLRGGSETALTTGGDAVERYGKADWVYFEEVYNRDWKAYQFSPDSQKIALMRYDDSSVREFNVIDHMTPRTSTETERYPKAGDPIPQVRLGVVDVEGGPVDWIELSDYSPDNLIITRFGWLPDSSSVYMLLQDRAQQWMDFVRYDLQQRQFTRLYRERSKFWVPDPGPVFFLADGSWIVCSGEEGWQHIYRIGTDGSRTAITAGDWEVSEIHDVDPENGWIYFSGTKDSHIAKNGYRVDIKSHQIQRLTQEAGSHHIQLSPDRKSFVDTFSTLQSPARAIVRGVDGDWRRVVDSNPVPALNQYRLSPVEYFTIPLSANYKMPCTMVKPLDFDETRQYPVWIMTYGGPHYPSVSDSWSGQRLGFDQMLAQMGIIAVRCDPRSASGQGAKSAWTAYRQLGVGETRDLEQAVDWLAEQAYVNKDRIGLSGYSYGGYLTAFALTHSKKFAAGVAGAPVTDWRNYDAFYTERFMNTPQENPDGYEASSVVAAAANLHGRLLLIHGAQDDNVHVQNTLQLAHQLQEANQTFEMMIYPTSRHGIHSPHYNRLFTDFIRRTMLQDE